MALAPEFLPLRLGPGADLRAALEALSAAPAGLSAFVVSRIGSLAGARLRLAGAQVGTEVTGDVEILSLAGTLSPDGAHLHMAIANAAGRVLGGHVGYGNLVRTTVELLVVQLADWRLGRQPDPTTGFKELVITRTSTGPGSAA